jgi:hypothetical protein
LLPDCPHVPVRLAAREQMERFIKHGMADSVLALRAQDCTAEKADLGDHGPGLHTVSFFIPLFQNPTVFGIRVPVWVGKIFLTLKEAQQHFPGFTLSLSLGWCREDAVWDPLLRLDVETQLNQEDLDFIAIWKESLRTRFEQRELYVKSQSYIRCI